MINNVDIQGIIASEIRSGLTRDGSAWAKFSLVHHDYKKASHFFYVTLWGKGVEAFLKYFSKGSHVLIGKGRIVQKTWEENGSKRYSTEIESNEWHFCGQSTSSQQGQQPGSTSAFSDDDIPF